MDAESRKQLAVEFLKAASSGRPKEAAKELFAPGAKHHNAFFPAGMEALTGAMADAAREAPEQRLEVQHVLADGDLVAVHSHVVPRPGEPGIAVVHLFRFEKEKVVEFWDVGQGLPKDSPNTDGAF